MHRNYIFHLNLKNPVQLNHYNTRKISQGQEVLHMYAAANCIDEIQVPFHLEVNFPFKHLNILLRRSMIEIDYDGQSTRIVQKDRICLMILNHVPDSITVSINCGINPPTFLFNTLCANRGYTSKQGQRWQ